MSLKKTLFLNFEEGNEICKLSLQKGSASYGHRTSTLMRISQGALHVLLLPFLVSSVTQLSCILGTYAKAL